MKNSVDWKPGASRGRAAYLLLTYCWVMGWFSIGIAKPGATARGDLGLLLAAIALAVVASSCTQSSTSLGPAPTKCQISLGVPSSTVAASGGSISVAITTEPECTWTATTSVSWMTLASSASGQGSSSVNVQISPNPVAATRMGSVTVNDQPLGIVQAAASCQFSLAPSSQTIAAAGGSSTIAVTATPGCTWSVTGLPSWITVTSGTSGNGNGTVILSVAVNPAGMSRTAVLTVAGQTLTMTQQAGGCSYSLDRASQTISAAGGAGTPIAITATPGCAWTATSSVTWITGVTPASGTGNGTVNFLVAANPNGTPRTGTLTVAGQTLTITQQPMSCSFSLAHAAQTISAAGGAGTPVVITAAPGCAWTAASSATWITGVTPASGTGNGAVNFLVAANPNGTPRTGTLTVAGQTVTVTEQALSCSYSLDHSSQTISAAGGAATPVVITATPGCAWTAASNATWITGVNPASGTGNGRVNFSVAANKGDLRTGTLTIAGKTFTVSEAKP
jgi:hypothetical protein